MDIAFPVLCDKRHVMQLMIMSRFCFDEAELFISETDSLRSSICISRVIKNLEIISRNIEAVKQRLIEIEK